MRYKMKIRSILILLFLLLNSCSSNIPSDAELESSDIVSNASDNDTTINLEITITEDSSFLQLENSPFEITEATISGDIFEIAVRYGGGCAEHQFEIYWNSRYLESEPPQVDLHLVHNDNDDSCEALLRNSIHGLSILRRSQNPYHWLQAGHITLKR